MPSAKLAFISFLVLPYFSLSPERPLRRILPEIYTAEAFCHSALRTRSYAGAFRLTWKGPRVPDPLLKIRPELETGVTDGAVLEAILAALGYRPTLRMEKVRAKWVRADLEACLDETPFGCYLELEGTPAAIAEVRIGLGLSEDLAEPRSYPQLYVLHGLG